jgi:hypothetical protein
MRNRFRKQKRADARRNSRTQRDIFNASKSYTDIGSKVDAMFQATVFSQPASSSTQGHLAKSWCLDSCLSALRSYPDRSMQWAAVYTDCDTRCKCPIPEQVTQSTISRHNFDSRGAPPEWGDFDPDLRSLWDSIEWPCDVPQLGARRVVDAPMDLQRVRYLTSLLNTKSCIRPGGMSVLWCSRCGPAASLVNAAVLQSFRVLGVPPQLKWVEFVYLQKPGRDPNNVDAWRDIAKVFPLILLYSYDVLDQGQAIALANAHSCLGDASFNTGYFRGVPTNEMAFWLSVFAQKLSGCDFTFTDLDYANCYPSSNFCSARGIAVSEGMPDWWSDRYMQFIQGFTQFCKIGSHSCSVIMQRGYLQGLATSTLGAQLDHAPLSRLLTAAGIGVEFRKLHVPMVGICDDGRVFYSWSQRDKVHELLNSWHAALYRRIRPDKGAEAVPPALESLVGDGDRAVYSSDVVFSKSGFPSVEDRSVKFQHTAKRKYPVMGGIPWAYTDAAANEIWTCETRTLALGVTSLFAHSVVRRFRIRAFDTVLLPRFMHRMQFFPFSFKQLRDLDSVQRSVHLHSLQLSTSTARSALLVTSNFTSVSDKADISMAASLIGMLGSRMLEHRRAAVYHLAQWMQQLCVVDHDVGGCVGSVDTVFGACAAPISSSSNAHQFVPVVRACDGGVRAPYRSKGRSCTRKMLWPWGPVFSVLAQAGLSLQSKMVDQKLSSGLGLSDSLFALADSFALGSFRDFRLVKANGSTISFTHLNSTLTSLVMADRIAKASPKFTVNEKPANSGKASLLISKLFSRLKLFSSNASSVHMLDLARANAWPHLSARTSAVISGVIPPPVPCSFCGRSLAQTSAHCLTSGACYAFQSLKVDRHKSILGKLSHFLQTRTSYSHVVSSESKLLPSRFRSNAVLKHNTPDLVVQDPLDGHTVILDVTVVMPSRLAFAHSSKISLYEKMGMLAQDYCSHHSTPPAGFVAMPTSCVVVPIVFSVFGDMHDESFSWLRTAASDNGCGVNLLAPFLSASCVAIASCASAVAVASSKMYAAAQRRL